MSFLDELQRVRQGKIDFEWVEKQKELALQNAAASYYEILKERLLIRARNAGLHILEGYYFIDSHSLYSNQMYDLGRDMKEKIGIEVLSPKRHFDGTRPDYSELIEEKHIDYGYHNPSGYCLKQDRDVRLHAEYGYYSCALSVGVALYGTVNCTACGVLKNKFHYSVEFNKYMHIFAELLKSMAQKDGISLHGPFIKSFRAGIEIAEDDGIILSQQLDCSRSSEWMAAIRYQILL
ncbi:MAG: hypothetical protein IKB75_00335 [Clostridia bacterium]|nr:hypothetical protein [Clostridia bacterium]